MPKEKLDAEGVREFIHEYVPSYNRNLVEASLTKDMPDLEELGLSLTGETRLSSFVINTGSGSKAEKSLWECVKKEVYEYFCTKSKKYKSERSRAELTAKNILTILATAIAAQFNLAIGVVAGAVTVAVVSVFKIGKNAWCEANATVCR